MEIWMTVLETKVRDRLADCVAGAIRPSTFDGWLAAFMVGEVEDIGAREFVREIQIHLDNYSGGYINRRELHAELRATLGRCDCGFHDDVVTDTGTTTIKRELSTQHLSSRLVPTG
jgi:hypothetical protein